MNSIKAIASGITFIIIAILLMQLIALFTIVGYNSLSKDYPFLSNISGTFGYLFTLTILCSIMFMGGYITALIANNKKLLHTLIVAFIATAGMVWLTFENSKLTSNGMLINGLMLIFTLLGGLYRKRVQIKSEKQ